MDCGIFAKHSFLFEGKFDHAVLDYIDHRARLGGLGALCVSQTDCVT